MSGGQKRRVDIARALIDHPDILFLDEPTAGLDLQTRIVIWDLLQKLQKEQGLTIFLTTHYLEEAENADQMYILENGNVLAEGSAEEIKEMYAPSRLLICLKQGQTFSTENGNVLAEGSAEEIKEMYAPSRLLICLKQGQTFSTNFKQISKSDDQIEIDGLNSNQVIDLLHKFEDKIDTFEYRKGSIDDAFIKIAGKELQ